MPAPRAAVLVAAASLAAGGCARSAHDRAGGTPAPAPQVLTLVTREDPADLAEWAAAVRRRSQGSLGVGVPRGRRAAGASSARGVLGDVRAHRADLAAVSVRALREAGVRSFDPLLAPLLVDGYALQQRVLAGPLPGRMLAGVSAL